MSGLFAAHVEAVLPHVLDDVAIANRRPRKREAEPLQVTLEPEVAHHRCNDTAAGKLAAAMPAFRDHGHQLIAIDDLALFIDDDDTVSIAIERNTDVGAHFAHLLDQTHPALSNRTCG